MQIVLVAHQGSPPPPFSYNKPNAFHPSGPVWHDFPVRISSFRLDSQSCMYQGNMQITMLLAKPAS